jgi:RHS repeat-associated protein
MQTAFNYDCTSSFMQQCALIVSRSSGKERDTESGLDYFGARYYGSTMGRFMSPDPLGGHPEDPQTLNKYVYVRNNPLSLTDPTGLDFYLTCTQDKTNGSTCQGGHQGTSDSKGNFTATVVTSDSIRNGQNSASIDEHGVEITSGGKTSGGEYFDNAASHTTDANGNDVNHNPIDLKGSGELTGFGFNINGNCNGTCLASGSFSFNGPRDFTGSVLELRGSFRSIVDRRIPGLGKSPDEMQFHPGTEQYRFGTGPSPHFSLPDNPKNAVPTVGPFHVDRDAPGIKHVGCAELGIGCN